MPQPHVGHTSAGDLSCDAGGLLLMLCKDSTLYILQLMNSVLGPLVRLSRSLQSSKNKIAEATHLALAVIEDFHELDFDNIEKQAAVLKKAAVDAGAKIERDNEMSFQTLKNVCQKYVKAITDNMSMCFSDDVSQLGALQLLFKEKKEDFKLLEKVTDLQAVDLAAEWRILRRMPGDLHAMDKLTELALSDDKQAMFLVFSAAARLMLLLPVGTASVERLFSLLNRVLCDSRYRLLPGHTSKLMLISAGGPDIPDVREGTDDEREAYGEFISSAFTHWMSKPRRGVYCET